MGNVNFVSRFLLIVALVSVLPLSACSVQEKSEGDDKNVQIQTPFGDLKVRTGVEAKDVGLRLYPGATPREPSGDDKHSANVQLGNDRFGLKVVAAEYESKDAPEKILDFYRKELKSYGAITECKGTQGGTSLESLDVDDDQDLKCDEAKKGDGVELKAGTSDRQRIVAVHPNGTGSRFALVYIQKHGREKI
jgi:hypothetical protein